MPSTEDSGVGVPVPPPTVPPPTTSQTPIPVVEVKPKPKWGKGALVGVIGAILVLVIGVFVGTSVVTNLQNKINLEKKAGDTGDCQRDITGACNSACCGASPDCPSGQTCNIPNGYCQSGKSCNVSSGGGYHQACDGSSCVNQPCPNNAASCANDCTSNSQCSSSPPLTPIGDCRYVNSGQTVSVTGDCSGYSFRGLVFRCNGPLSLSPTGRCEDKGIHPGFEAITFDQTGITSVSLGSVPNCKSKQADLTVVSRPNNRLSGDELPGTPRVPNYVLADGNQSGCGSTPTPTPTPPTSYQCQQVKVFRGGTEITASQIQLGDTIVFRGFASAENTTVSKIRFVLTKGGVDQSPAEVNATLVGALYQADYQVTINSATSYTVVATAISP